LTVGIGLIFRGSIFSIAQISSSWPFLDGQALFRRFIATPVDPGDFFHFVESKNDIAEVFIVIAGPFPDVGDADSIAATPDDVQNGFCGTFY